MMRLTDAAKLATTKLRTRKVRLVVTVIIAGLMFTTLATASLVSRGTFDSLASFNREAFGERYIIAAYPQTNNIDDSPASNAGVIKRAGDIQKELIARKTAEAKKLGIPYDPKSESPIVSEHDSSQGKQRYVNLDSPAGKQALKEYAAAHRSAGLDELRKLAGPYQPVSYYKSKTSAQGVPDSPIVKVLKDGKESFEPNQTQNIPSTSLDSFGSSWALISRDLIKPFILPGASATIGSDGSIPVVAPYSAVEQLAGLKALPSTANPSQRLERLKQVRSQAQHISFEVCYRNRTSVDLLNQAISQQQEIAQNKNDKDYVKPKLVHGLPPKPCTAPVVVSDSRSTAEKTQATKQAQFKRALGEADPEQVTLKMRVIGVTPDPPGGNASVLVGLASFLLSSNLGLLSQSWFTPIELETLQPQIAAIFDKDLVPDTTTTGQYVEFKTAAQARDFIEHASCQQGFSIATGPPGANAQSGQQDECARQGKVFGLLPFGSNSLALEDAKKGFVKFFTFAALAVAAIAAIIMVGTVGRIIADSRRETAVFRAIGAKKLDIVQIYLIYSFFLSLLIFGFTLAVSAILASLTDRAYAPEITVQALVAYNSQDLSKAFSLFQFYPPDMIRLLALALAGGALSACLPLLRNLRRNPIRDMRDDT